MTRKHIIYVHGRSTKPAYEEKVRLIRKAMIAGLARVDEGAARDVEDERIKFTMAYYGDITNRIIVGEQPELKKDMVEKDGVWYEPDGVYDEAIERLLSRPTHRHTKGDYERLIEKERNERFHNEMARIASPVLSLFGVGSTIVRTMFPDLREYFVRRVVASEVWERLEGELAKSLLAGDDIALISHSMGTIVAYDVLWKFSRMNNFREMFDKKVSLWITFGCPLGDPSVQKNLIDRVDSPEHWYPANVEAWINMSATDDIVAHNIELRKEYDEMLRRKLVGTINDIAGIYTFYCGRDGSNPHKSYGYLNHPALASLIAAWMWSP